MGIENIELKQKLCKEYAEKIELYDRLSVSMEDYLSRLIKRHGISVKSINARTKNLLSLSKKIETKNYKYSSLEQITDLSGLRVITYYSDDVYKVEDIINNHFLVDRQNSIDKAKTLEYDRFGYLSLHYVVQLPEIIYSQEEYREFKGLKFEIQIRSILQDAWAEIEHDLGYKNKNGVPQKVKRDFSRLAGLLELADKEFQSIRDYIANYEDEIVEEVKVLKEPIVIDDVSIRAYIRYNEYYRALLYKFGEEVSIKKMNMQADIAKQLLSVDIYTLNEVEDLIKNNLRFILNMMKYEKVRIYNFIGEADILLYVCYAKVLRGNNPERDLIDFWDRNGYSRKGITEEHKKGWIEDLKKYMKM